MIVLDTNVVSELMRAAPAPVVVDWVDRQRATEVHLTAITVAELLYGVGRLPGGSRKTELAERIEAMLSDDFDHRVLPFDETSAAHYADIVVRRERAGRPISTADAQIAATCRSHRARLATRNTDDFADTGITLHNPWTED
ncbi:MAG: type II toxin-antitoxin system VapC family toxin [Acidimicrobiales bacterium]